MQILDILTQARVAIDVHAASKKAVLEELARLVLDKDDGQEDDDEPEAILGVDFVSSIDLGGNFSDGRIDRIDKHPSLFQNGDGRADGVIGVDDL